MALNLDIVNDFSDTINKSNIKGANAADRLNRNSSDARQAQWMLQLDRAWLESGAKGNEPAPQNNAPKREENAGRQPNTQRNLQKQQSEQQNDSAGGVAVVNNWAAANVAVSVGASGNSDASGIDGAASNAASGQNANAMTNGDNSLQNNGDNALANRGAMAAQQLYSSYQEQTSASAGKMAAAGASAAAGVSQFANTNLLAGESSISALAGIGAISTATTLGGAKNASMQTPLALAASSLANQTAVMPSKIGLFGAALSHGAQSEQGELALGLDANSDEVSSASASEQANAEPYEKQALHLYHGADGVHAWLRDAQLQPQQMQGVAQAMASQLQAQGSHLASLSINGKRLLDNAAATNKQEDEVELTSSGRARAKSSGAGMSGIGAGVSAEIGAGDSKMNQEN